MSDVSSSLLACVRISVSAIFLLFALTGPTAATVAPGQSLLLPNNSAASSVPTSGAVLPTGEPLSLPCVGPAPSLISVPVVLSSSSTACASSAEGQSLLRQEFLNIGGLSLPAAMGLDALDSLGKSSLPGQSLRLASLSLIGVHVGYLSESGTV